MLRLLILRLPLLLLLPLPLLLLLPLPLLLLPLPLCYLLLASRWMLPLGKPQVHPLLPRASRQSPCRWRLGWRRRPPRHLQRMMKCGVAQVMKPVGRLQCKSPLPLPLLLPLPLPLPLLLLLLPPLPPLPLLLLLLLPLPLQLRLTRCFQAQLSSLFRSVPAP